MTDVDNSPTGTLKRIAPGVAWLPRIVREKLTPALVGSVVTTLFMGVAYLLNSPQKDIHRLQDAAAISQQDRARDRELLQQLVTGQAVMNGKVDSIASEVDRQREWRERIEDVAEAPPHARRHR